MARRLVAGFLAELDRLVLAAEPTGVLDVGCGEGIVSARIARLLAGVPVEGLDVDDPELAARWREHALPNLSFRPGSAYRLPHATDSVDVVCAVEVFEHLERPGDALAEVARVARREIILTTPREPIWRLANLASGRYLRRWGNTPGHVNHWSRRDLVRFAGRVGTVAEVRSPFPWTMIRLECGRSPSRGS